MHEHNLKIKMLQWQVVITEFDSRDLAEAMILQKGLASRCTWWNIANAHQFMF